MTVLAIEETFVHGNYKDNYVEVIAIVDHVRLVYHQTLYDAPEYAPALCSAIFALDPDESIPTDEDGFCRYLDQLDLDWQPIDTSDY
jgi:hypothetical protein